MDFGWNWLAGGALVGGLLAACWRQVRTIGGRIRALAITTIELDSVAGTSLADYLAGKAKPSATRDRVYVGQTSAEAGTWYGSLEEDMGKKASLFWFGWRPIWYMPEAEQTTPATISSHGSAPSAAKEAANSTTRSASVTYLRGTIDIEKILALSLQKRMDNNSKFDRVGRFGICIVMAGQGRELDYAYGGKTGRTQYTCERWRRVWDNGKPDDQPIVSRLVLPAEADLALREARTWLSRRDWYAARGLAWRRGLMLHGIPGTGKTSMAKALAHDLGLPLYVLRLAGMSDYMFMKAWSLVKENTPSAVLIEDIDAVFDGRRNISNAAGPYDDEKSEEFGGRRQGIMMSLLSFDTLINTLDGAERADGVFVVITTNNPAKVDPALGGQGQSRPGRVDRVIELKPMTTKDKVTLAQKLLAEHPTLLNQFVKDAETLGKVETPAQVQERCVSMALAEMFEEERNPPNSDTHPTWPLPRKVEIGPYELESTEFTPDHITAEELAAEDARAGVGS